MIAVLKGQLKGRKVSLGLQFEGTQFTAVGKGWRWGTQLRFLPCFSWEKEAGGDKHWCLADFLFCPFVCECRVHMWVGVLARVCTHQGLTNTRCLPQLLLTLSLRQGLYLDLDSWLDQARPWIYRSIYLTVFPDIIFFKIYFDFPV